MSHAVNHPVSHGADMLQTYLLLQPLNQESSYRGMCWNFNFQADLLAVWTTAKG
jgi:hypothetical protein